MSKKRERPSSKKKKQRRRHTSRTKTFIIAGGTTLLLAIGVYSTLEDPDKVKEGVYELENFGIDVATAEGFSGEVIDPIKLTIYGDKKKVTKMRKAGEIPEVVIDMTDKKEGEYEGKPEVEDTKYGVKYKFAPESVSVKIMEASLIDMPTFEHGYGLTGEGYRVSSIVAKEPAEVIATKEQAHLIGQIVVEVDVTGLTETVELDGKVIVLDKRGKEMTNLNVKNPTIPTTINIEPMPWRATEIAIEELEKEITELESGLKKVREEEKTVTDVLQKEDLRREISFRENRLTTKQQEILEKRESLVGQKEVQEQKKAQDVRKSVLDGGKVIEEDKPEEESTGEDDTKAPEVDSKESDTEDKADE